jgi:CxxC motif-containing protein (DUF1111 family)
MFHPVAATGRGLRMVIGRLLAAGIALASTAVAAQTPPAFVVQGLNEFRRPWVPVPEVSQWDGLGPLFSARSCLGCHYGTVLSGRMVTADNGQIAARGLTLHLGDGTGRPDPMYGRQVQTLAVQRVPAEGRMTTRVDPALPVGYRIDLTLLQGPLAPGVVKSARLAPALLGRAAIDSVDPAAIVALAAQQADSGGPVAGTVRYLPDGEVGRYGFKAEYPDLAGQIAHAFSVDMGLSTEREPDNHGDCTTLQAICRAVEHGGDLARNGAEVSTREIDQIIAYLASRPAPAQHAAAPAGNALLDKAGCSDCHVRALPTVDGGETVLYSDLLLHDMGPDFADTFAIPGVAATQWRTAPLLALGAQNGRRFLHDGRAETLEAAILWHGGEAGPARDAFMALPPADRAALLSFLTGL